MAKTRYAFTSIAHAVAPFFPLLELQLKQARIEATALDYLAETFDFIFKNFLFLTVSIFLVLIIAGQIRLFLLFLIGILVLCLLLFTRRIAYPKFLATKTTRDLENNLLPVVRTLIIQVESGVPLFTSLVGISNENYGEVSKSLKKAIREINAGRPEIEALEQMADESPSIFFRRAMWQITNGMKGGSDIAVVLREVAKSLSEEQIDQINEYGSTLNPLAMFYMMIAIIMPTLAITFFIVMSSFIGIQGYVVQLVLWVFYVIVILMQIVFLGVIKSRRPNLLRE
ncbi:MAG TPA: type II secretion system F family protein [Candidatus Nanoarchaeia archaeon]|nr:type II secretion system F family protein [Candidatus Nanoarchaeia archaeon]